MINLEINLGITARSTMRLTVRSKNKIDTNIISVYDRVMDARDGLAVVPIVGSGCGGCGAHIPPQTLTEVRAKTGIHRCDICGRFLYNEEKVVN